MRWYIYRPSGRGEDNDFLHPQGRGTGQAVLHAGMERAYRTVQGIPEWRNDGKCEDVHIGVRPENEMLRNKEPSVETGGIIARRSGRHRQDTPVPAVSSCLGSGACGAWQYPA